MDDAQMLKAEVKVGTDTERLSEGQRAWKEPGQSVLSNEQEQDRLKKNEHPSRQMMLGQLNPSVSVWRDSAGTQYSMPISPREQ
jgi:hypothetical protein